MESEVCSFQKFGFYKFKGDYKKRHFAQICEDLQEWKGLNNVEKGIQKPAKKIYFTQWLHPR